MKFGKTIETDAKGLPEEWQPYIIQYKLLKKNIKTIVEELGSTFRTLNLSPPPATIDPSTKEEESKGDDDSAIKETETAVQPDNTSIISEDDATTCDISLPTTSMDSGPQDKQPEEIIYNIEKDGEGVVHPVITVRIRKPKSAQRNQLVELPDVAGLPTHSSILVPCQNSLNDGKDIVELETIDTVQQQQAMDSNITMETKMLDDDVEETQVTVRLQADQHFFDKLINYIDRIKTFEGQYRQHYSTDVGSLSTELGTITSPFKHDFEIWREIFRLYMDTNVWSHAEGDFCHSNTAREVQDRFAKFTKHIETIGLPNKFRDPLSAKLLMNFYRLNLELTNMKLLQELNEQAARKIIKKHDKRTHLIAKTQFPQFVTIDTATLIQGLITTMHDDLVGVVPQLDDYLCPMCFNIFWRPLRLDCGHLFCSRCIVKASRRRMFNCPICRSKDAIYRAGVDHIDQAMLNFLKLYFPREIKEKQKDIQREITDEETSVVLAARANHKPCILM